MSTYIISIDLGQLSDRTALSIIERQQANPLQEGYACRHLEVWPPGTHQTQILDDVVKIMRTMPSLRNSRVALDITAAGTFAATLFKERLRKEFGIGLTAFKITGGTTVVKESYWKLRVPKSELVSVLRGLLETKRFSVAQGLSHSLDLVNEMRNFKVTKITNDDTPDWRERDHDDLVLAVGIACWLHETRRRCLVAFI